MRRFGLLKHVAVKILLWIFGILVCLLLLVQIFLSPAVLEPVVDRFADYWLDCDVSFGRLGVNVFRNFPNVTVTVDDCLVKYDAGKFEKYTRNPEDAGCSRASRAGSYIGILRPGEECDTVDLTGRYDTLAVMSAMRVSVNPFALVYRQLRIKQIAITDLKGYAHRFDTLAMNWNIIRDMGAVREEREDSSGFRMPVPVIGRITLDGNPRVVFTDRLSDAFLLVSLESLDLKGNRSSGKSLLQSFRLKADSLLVANRHSGSTSAISVDKLRLHSAREYGVDGSVSASFMIADTLHGRMKFPVDVSFSMDVPPDSVMKVDVQDFSGEICRLPFSLKGSVSLPKDSLGLDVTFDILDGKLGALLEEYGPSFSRYLGDVRTDAEVNIHAEANGHYIYSTGELPRLIVNVAVPESDLLYRDEDMADFSLRCSASGKGRRLDAVLEGLSLYSSGGTRIEAEGRADDLLGKDPTVRLKTAADADLTWWSDLLGSDTTFRFSGNLSADINGKMRLSQMNLQRYSRADIDAGVSVNNVKFLMPADSIDVFADSLSVRIGAKRNDEFDKIARGARVMVSSVTADTAFLRIGHRMEVFLKDLSCTGLSDGTLLSDAAADSISFHPYYLQVTAGRLALMDSDSSRVTLRNTDNVLKLSYLKDNDTVPTVDLTSRTKMIGLRTRGLLAGVRSASLSFRAVKGGGATLHGGRRDGGTVRRDTLRTETDDDLHFSMGESFQKLYRKWSAHGSLSFKSSVIRSPKFPLRTSVSDMDLRFTTNMLNLNSLKVKAGDTEISLGGSISGVRRAVLGSGVIRAELNVDSRKMDVNELLAAIAVGSKDTTQTILAGEDTMTSSLNASDAVDVEREAENISSPLLMLPGNVDAVCRLSGHSISVSNMVVDSLSTVMEMRNRCLRVSEIKAMTNIGNLSFEGFYATPSRDDVSLGMDLELVGVTAAEVLDMVPSIDTLMPMLSSFNGKLKCQVAGTTHLDTNMRIVMPTVTGVLRIGGDSLHLDQTPTIRKITRLLLFRDKHSLNIKTMSVDAQIHDSQLEVFPFILDIDRYKLASSGRIGLDGSCSYHLSILKSPVPFKLGLDIRGDDYEHLKFRVVKPKYRDEEKVPAFSVTVDETREVLSRMISDIFVKGVGRVMSHEELLKAVDERKQSLSYRAAEEQKSEAISQEELDRMKRESGARE